MITHSQDLQTSGARAKDTSRGLRARPGPSSAGPSANATGGNAGGPVGSSWPERHFQVSIPDEGLGLPRGVWWFVLDPQGLSVEHVAEGSIVREWVAEAIEVRPEPIPPSHPRIAGFTDEIGRGVQA